MRRSARDWVRKKKIASTLWISSYGEHSMERDLWRSIVASIRRLPRRRPRGAVYTNRQIVAVQLWAALHDRPTSWACRRDSWPPSAWRRTLPDQSTMSRRLREPAIRDDLDTIRRDLERALPAGHRLLADGKALPLSDRSRDPDAATGWASSGFEHGYKLHAVIDDRHRVVGWALRPMNDAECTVARGIIGRAEIPGSTRTMLADAGFDSVPLYEACAARGVRLTARRRKPGRGFADRGRHPDRVRAARLLEGRSDLTRRAFARARWSVERFFARLTVAGTGLGELPPWVRGLRRVELWVAAKLVVNAARIALTQTTDA
jgi:hypothetical protein